MSPKLSMTLQKISQTGWRGAFMIGKIKTTAQMSAIPLLLYQAPVAGYDIRQAGTWLIYVAAVLTLWSMGYYMRMAWPQIALHKDN